MMKPLIALLILFSSLHFTTRPAEAGILIGSFYGNTGKGAIVGAAIGGAVISSSLIALTVNDEPSAELGLFTGFLLSIPFTVGLTLLDVDAALSQDELIQGFQSAFPYIDNPEVLSDIVRSTHQKFEQLAVKNPSSTHAWVRFDRDEILELTQNADLTDTELEHLIASLQ
jgi:hypothetical protein